MITDKDAVKLKKEFSKVFATKNELSKIETSLRSDLKQLESRIEKSELTLKKEIENSAQSIITAISDVVESFGIGIKGLQTDSVEKNDILNDHEIRLEKLEKNTNILHS